MYGDLGLGGTLGLPLLGVAWRLAERLPELSLLGEAREPGDPLAVGDLGEKSLTLFPVGESPLSPMSLFHSEASRLGLCRDLGLAVGLVMISVRLGGSGVTWGGVMMGPVRSRSTLRCASCALR